MKTVTEKVYKEQKREPKLLDSIKKYLGVGVAMPFYVVGDSVYYSNKCATIYTAFAFVLFFGGYCLFNLQKIKPTSIETVNQVKHASMTTKEIE